jgi:hypothetical protein
LRQCGTLAIAKRITSGQPRTLEDIKTVIGRYLLTGLRRFRVCKS